MELRLTFPPAPALTPPTPRQTTTSASEFSLSPASPTSQVSRGSTEGAGLQKWTACLTCRSRKVKCSQDRPACEACQRAALQHNIDSPMCIYLTHEELDQVDGKTKCFGPDETPAKSKKRKRKSSMGKSSPDSVKRKIGTPAPSTTKPSMPSQSPVAAPTPSLPPPKPAEFAADRLLAELEEACAQVALPTPPLSAHASAEFTVAPLGGTLAPSPPASPAPALEQASGAAPSSQAAAQAGSSHGPRVDAFGFDTSTECMWNGGPLRLDELRGWEAIWQCMGMSGTDKDRGGGGW